MFKTSCIASVLALVLGSSFAFAKSDLYNRGGTASTTTPVDDSDTTGAPGSKAKNSKKAATTATDAAPATTTNGEKKVDLSDLESRYWTAKDTEFNVVQNRLYTKAKKFSLTPMVGVDLSSIYTNDYNFGLALNYYFSERQGIEIQGWKTNSNKSSFVSSLEGGLGGTVNGASYNYNNTTGYIGVNYNWVPIYAKISLLEKRILYFDMSINPGIGVTLLQSNSFSVPNFPGNSINQTAFTAAIDISQQVFLTEHWAIKLDIDSHMYPENVYYAASNGSTISSGQQVNSKFTYSAIFMLGVTFFQ